MKSIKGLVFSVLAGAFYGLFSVMLFAAIPSTREYFVHYLNPKISWFLMFMTPYGWGYAMELHIFSSESYPYYYLDTFVTPVVVGAFVGLICWLIYALISKYVSEFRSG